MTARGTTPDDDRKGRASKPVLMVLYFFPPVGGVSMARNVRNVQYLPRFGWRPVVLTPRHAAFPLRDPAAMALVDPATAVVRTASVEAGHVRPLAVRVRDAMKRRVGTRRERPGRRGAALPASVGVPGAVVTETAATSVLSRSRRLVFFPDDQVGWLPFAVVAAARAVRRHRAKVVFSTSSPVTAHLIAGLVARLAGIAWVAEFRDPWLGNALDPPLPWLHRRLTAMLERWVVGRADRVVTVTPSLTRLYEQRYPALRHFVTIPNGYDRTERVRVDPASHGAAPRGAAPSGAAGGSDATADVRTFRLVHAGSLYRPSELETFLEGVELSVARRPEVGETLRIALYGDITPECRAVVERFRESGPLGPVVEVCGFVPRETALRAVAEANAALVLLGAGPGMELFVGGKLYDYVGQDTQVLAMVPPGDARAVLESLSWGVVADPEPAAVADALERLLALPEPDRPADPDGRFDRVNLAARLADVLAEAELEHRANRGRK